MFEFAPAEFESRIKALQKALIAQEIDVAILNVNTDIYYYCGSIHPLYLLIPAAGQAVALARKALAQIGLEAPFVRSAGFANTKDLKGICQKFHLNKARRIGLVLENSAYATVCRWQQVFEGAALSDLSWEIRRLRMVKSATEIAIQIKAGTILAQVPQVVQKSFQPGMTELELTAAIEYFFRLNGHSGLVRCRRESVEMTYGVCAAGVNSLAGTKFEGVCAGKGTSPAVPYGAAAVPIERGQPVVLDYAFNYRGYHVDQTRMFCWGKPPDAFLQAYDAMTVISREIIAGMRPGQNWSLSYQVAFQKAAAAGYEDQFMGCDLDKVRFVGHGVGLELDEPPFLAPRMEEFLLEENMVIAVEPKVALPGLGIVGIEDTVVLRKDQTERITDCDPAWITF